MSPSRVESAGSASLAPRDTDRIHLGLDLFVTHGRNVGGLEASDLTDQRPAGLAAHRLFQELSNGIVGKQPGALRPLRQFIGRPDFDHHVASALYPFGCRAALQR